MLFDCIVSTRNLISGCCYDVVYRWEDVISRAIGAKVVADERKQDPNLKRFGESSLLRLIYMFFPWVANSISTGCNCLVFELDIWRNPGHNKKNIVPCIIDFWERSWIHRMCFWLLYRNCRAVLISSKEAYDFLKSTKTRVNIYHWALSIPDEMVSPSRMTREKKYDMAIFGRVNPLLLGYALRYASEHSDFTFLRKAKIDGRWAYVKQNGEMVGFADTYESYVNFMEQVKIGVYCTPGMDAARESTHGFNQVTPRFLEYISAGCHVIARYPINSDVEYFDLPSMCTNIIDYAQFCREVDRMRKEPIDVDKYISYLSRHKTSVRVCELKSMLDNFL